MPIAALFGSSLAEPADSSCVMAARLAHGLAGMGFTVKTGGYGGVMEAASRAAREAGGEVVGVTLESPGDVRRANRWLSREIRRPDLLGRLRALIEGTDIFYAIENGGPGTLNELFLVWAMKLLDELPGPPLVLVGPGWDPLLALIRERMVLTTRALDCLVLAPDVESALSAAQGLHRR